MGKINKWYAAAVAFLAVVLVVLISGIAVIEIRRQQAADILPEYINIVHAPPVDTASSAADTALNNQKIGEVGEIKIKDEATGEETSLITPEIPGVITSAVGRIVSITGNAVRISSEGSNFADGVARSITGVVTEETTIIAENGAKRFKGTIGLAALKNDQQVLVEGEGNIRGKIEFNIRSINVLN